MHVHVSPFFRLRGEMRSTSETKFDETALAKARNQVHNTYMVSPVIRRSTDQKSTVQWNRLGLFALKYLPSSL